MPALSAKVLFALFAQCAPDVAPETLNTLISVESQRNPYAIAIVYDKNVKKEEKLTFEQPNSESEALKIITELQNKSNHKSFSVGLMQINSANFSAYGINNDNMFNTCKNIETGAAIFKSCYSLAQKNNPGTNEQDLLRIASSCYYSGNEITGFKTENNGTSYVDRINNSIAKNYKVPAIKPLNETEEDSVSTTQNDFEPHDSQRLKVKSWDIFEDYPSNF
ncbi:lytic transglycosylase domain-containing protein [Gilliamella sp. W8126]|uniref:lytic transglycosylase domain-containing protein n=1 Tax=Gilliamella sp. W8126 TaxID=2750946 RepID=UPI0018DDE852|nr:lytic transglycosylase domain-containing protein [Gilliamella sp. W8126]MBI0006998.1 lytic transglycosylase domain-containing protein [Gilliamella sp. W8126]